MKNLKYYMPILITLAISTLLIVSFRMYETSIKEGMTDTEGNTINLETPIASNGYIDQMVDDSAMIQNDAQNILDMTDIDQVLNSSQLANLQNAVTNQQNIQSGLANIKNDYNTVLDGLQNEVDALVSIRTNSIQEKRQEFESLKTDRQNKKRIAMNNKYYEKRYMALSSIMIRVSIIIIVFTGLIWLNNRGYLGETAPVIIFPVLVAFSMFYILSLYVDMQQRSSTDFDKYNFVFNPNEPPTTGSESFTTFENSAEAFGDIKVIDGEFNRVKKYNKEYGKEDGKFATIKPFVKT